MAGVNSRTRDRERTLDFDGFLNNLQDWDALKVGDGANFSKAIECYSRSIALSPSSVAFANRAMSYLKLKRYEEAEVDCTEALNLDDRYVKAYSRRATARKELGKLKSSLEDSEFALRLEPNNQELRKLYTETKALSDERKIAKKQGEKPLAHDAIPTRITTPRTAYELEVSWRLLSGDSQKQTNLLKSIPPGSLPQLFKNALSAPMLIEIIRTTSTFFREEMELAVSILDNLTKVPRFDMIIMCLSAPDRADLRRIWDEVFSGDAAPYEHAEAFARLRRRYCTGV
ncbi:unnamed protein product [Spirodela intermedia]|uniref:RNA-polymerase II-associated protein 3-like C-terminal domain-containing protein n=1 Tax=Spirodela intermedia TaxID=51605 RepID=A0A7I8I9Z4_SPIIN|nr:unnamed protein product [Spirodela intermedia]CAA6654410.1 unnamed protein product [Spirodela intermedia]